MAFVWGASKGKAVSFAPLTPPVSTAIVDAVKNELRSAETSDPAAAGLAEVANLVEGVSIKLNNNEDCATDMLESLAQHNPIACGKHGVLAMKVPLQVSVAAISAPDTAVMSPSVLERGGVPPPDVLVDSIPVQVSTAAVIPAVDSVKGNSLVSLGGGATSPVHLPIVVDVAPAPVIPVVVASTAVQGAVGPVFEDEVAAVRGRNIMSVAESPALSYQPLEQRAKRPQVVSIKRLLTDVSKPPVGINHVRVPTVKSKDLQIIEATSWRDETSELVSETLLFRAMLHGTEVRILYDTGSMAQLMNASVADTLGIPTVRANMVLEFAGGEEANCSRRTTRQLLYIQDGYFHETFLVAERDIPGVDIILGMGFAKRSGAHIVWPAEGSTDVPYLAFRDGSRWYGEDVIGGVDNGLSCYRVSTREVRRFVREDARDLSVLAVSVENLLSSPQEGVTPVARVAPVIHELLRPVLAEYAHIFRDDLPLDLPAQRAGQPNSQHHIPLIEGAMPVKVRPIPMSWGERLILRDLLEELLAKGYISPAPPDCPWSAPIFLLKKGNGDKPGPTSARWRVITDYRALNALTKPSVYVPPSVREVIDSLVHKRVFSRSDNLSGFYQASLAVEDREKTTFTCFTPEGKKSYFFNVSCLGLQGAPSSYQLFMEQVIAGIPGVVCYIDDLAYSSDSMEEHAVLLRTVFQRLSDNQVYLNAAKCQWGLKEMDFLGMHISHNHVRITDDRVQGLRDYPVPKSFDEVRRFVGFVNYVGHFVPNFSRSIVTITDMLKAQDKVKKKFVWTEAANKEFNEIRKQLIESAGLVIPDLRGEFVLETDASGLGMGAVLFQFTHERLVPVWFLSRKFNSAEIHYNTRDREALAVTWALRKCRPYLALRKFVLYSDHESLANFKVQPGLKGKDWRHQEIVGEYEFEQRYRQGHTMVSPDALSRAFDAREVAYTVWQEVEHELYGVPLPPAGSVPVAVHAVTIVESGPRQWRPAERNARMRSLCLFSTPTTWDEVQRFISTVASFSSLVPEWRALLRVVLGLWRSQRRRPFQWPTAAEAEFRSVCRVLSAMGGGPRLESDGRPPSIVAQTVRVAPISTVRPEVVVPEATPFVGLDPAVVQDGYERVLQRIDGVVGRTTISGDWKADVCAAYESDELYGPIIRLCNTAVESLSVQQRVSIQHYKVLDNLLFFAPRGAGDMRLCVPVSPGNALRLVLLYDSHETGIHGGVEKTYARLAARYFWPNMLSDVTRYINSCRSCRLNKSRRRGEQGALTGLPIPAERWQVVQMDWITDLPVTALGYNQVLVVEDRLTKYAYFIPAKKTDTAEDAARRVFAVVFCVHGVPETIVSDRDRLWTSDFFGSLMALMHVKQSMGTAYYHDFNGAVECLNKTVEVMLRHLISEFPARDFDELLPMAQWAYNTSIHTATRLTPYYSLYGVEPREPMNLVAVPGAKLPPAVTMFAEHQAGVLAITRDALYKAQATMLAYENRDRREANFAVGDKVFLSTANLGKSHFTTSVEKLRQRFIGPFEITEKRSDYKYRLKLPKHLKDIYPVFHASLLWRAVPTPDDMVGRLGAGVSFEEAEPVVGEGMALLTHDDAGVPVYVIEKVMARLKSGRGYRYLIKWEGFPPEENSWITRSDAVTTAAARALDNFDAAQLGPVGQEPVDPGISSSAQPKQRKLRKKVRFEEPVVDSEDVVIVPRSGKLPTRRLRSPKRGQSKVTADG